MLISKGDRLFMRQDNLVPQWSEAAGNLLINNYHGPRKQNAVFREKTMIVC
jgi:hypothetical protein